MEIKAFNQTKTASTKLKDKQDTEKKTVIYLTNNREIVLLYKDLKIYKKKYTSRKTGKGCERQFTTKRKPCPMCIWKYIQPH